MTEFKKSFKKPPQGQFKKPFEKTFGDKGSSFGKGNKNGYQEKSSNNRTDRGSNYKSKSYSGFKKSDKPYEYKKSREEGEGSQENKRFDSNNRDFSRGFKKPFKKDYRKDYEKGYTKDCKTGYKKSGDFNKPRRDYKNPRNKEEKGFQDNANREFKKPFKKSFFPDKVEYAKSSLTKEERKQIIKENNEKFKGLTDQEREEIKKKEREEKDKKNAISDEFANRNGILTSRPAGTVRIAKYMADCGICSRRQAEEFISQGKVKVDGQIITSRAFFIKEGSDIQLDNQAIVATKNKKVEIYCLNKPLDYVSTTRDEKDRPTVFDLVPKKLGYLVKIGRLDINSEGLMLFTNSGELAHKMETGSIQRIYRVKAFGIIDKKKLERMQAGVIIDGVPHRPLFVEPEESLNKQKANHWLKIGLESGKNREVRKLLNHFNIKVNRLIRVAYGPVKLGNMPKGSFAKISDDEKEQLLKEVRKMGF